MRKTLLSALAMIALTAQLTGCNGNTSAEQPNESSSVVSDISEPQNSTSSSTESSSSSKPQSSSTATTSSELEVSEPQSSTVSTTSSEPETSSSESNFQPEETSKDDTPQWMETAVSGERYVNTDYISSRVNAIQGSNTVKQYRLNDKVTVVAKTDTNYYKLEDGTFIHADYLSESKVTVQQPQTTTSSSTSNGQGETIGAEKLSFVELDDGTLSVNFDDSVYKNGYKEIENIIIPAEYNGKKVTQIAEKAFTGFTNLKSVTIPEGITKIGERAFNGCDKLEYIKFPKSLKVIEPWAFCVCRNLKTVIAQSKLDYVGFSAFSSTPFVDDQNGAVYLGNWLVECSKGTTAVDIKDGTYAIAYSAFSYNSYEYIKVPESVTHIEAGAFSSCTIENLKIPLSITSMEGGWFDSTALGNLTIPNTVTYIDPKAMNGGMGCRRLDNLYYTGTEEEWNKLLQNSGWDGKIVYDPIRFGEQVEPTPIEYKIHFNSEGPDIP